jgi:DNA-directed RNA polymerase specialized sigma subunit
MRKPMSKYRHMTREKAEEIRKAYFARELTQKQLSAKYAISQAAVCRIISGYTWNAREAHRSRAS